LVAGAGWLALDLTAPALTSTSCPCKLSSLSPVDRPAASWHWAPGQGLAYAALGVAWTTAVAEVAVGDRDLPALGTDLGLLAESTLLSGLATEGSKITVARPYPYMYGAAASPSQQRDGINYASFWSGHAAVAMAATVSAASLLERRHAPIWLRAVAWTAGPLLAVGAGALMASSGNHFPSDVVAGAAAGAAIGYGNVVAHSW
jgi:membrane-associated phospholipid phosphatase